MFRNVLTPLIAGYSLLLYWTKEVVISYQGGFL